MSQVEIADERPLNYYRTEIPNIVFDIGLSSYELALYSVLRRTAGPGGKCTKGVRRLAEESGMGHTKVAEIRKLLCEPREQLGGKPLIRVEQVEDRHFVTIVDIWRENFDRFGVSATRTPVRHADTPCPRGGRKKKLSTRKNDDATASPEPSMQSKVDLPPELDSDEFVEAFDRWIAQRRKLRIKPYTDDGAMAQLKILAVIGQARAIAAINYSIAQGFQGIYESTEAKKNANGRASNGNRNEGTYNDHPAERRPFERLS